MHVVVAGFDPYNHRLQIRICVKKDRVGTHMSETIKWIEARLYNFKIFSDEIFSQM
jgi:hypothetical protein